MIWTRDFGLKATELLQAGAAEALPRNCSVWSCPNLLLSPQTGYCISHDTVAVCTHTVMRARGASKNTLCNLSVTALPIDLGFCLNKASSSGHFLWCSIPSPPRPTLGATALRCQVRCCANTQTPHLPSLSNASMSWQCTSQVEGIRELLRAASCFHLADGTT